MILNEWAEDETAKLPPQPVMDLPDLHPVVARGVMEWLNDPRHLLPQGAWQKIAPYAASIAVRASV